MGLDVYYSNFDGAPLQKLSPDVQRLLFFEAYYANENDPRTFHEKIVSPSGYQFGVLLDNRWKYIRKVDNTRKRVFIELYDLKKDPQRKKKMFIMSINCLPKN